jgi:hypothetical protein
MSLRIAALALAAAAIAGGGCTQTCLTTRQDGPGLGGTMAYTTADGTTVEATLDDAGVQMTGAAAIAVYGSFVDVFGDTRDYEVHGHDLSPTGGTSDVAGHGEVCLPRRSDGESVCSDLVGTIDVRQLSADCYHHESGVSACAETIDFTLHVTSPWQGTMFRLDGDELTIGTWVDVSCED